MPADLAEIVAARRGELIEAIVESDDELLARYLDEEDWSRTRRRGLRKATLAGRLVPVMCGASLQKHGVQPVLDAIVDYLPSAGRAAYRGLERQW